MLIPNWKEKFGLHGLYKNISALQEFNYYSLLQLRPKTSNRRHLVVI